MKMRHRRIRSWVGPFLDGELDARRSAAVQAHLAECWECSGAAQVHRLVRTALRRLATERVISLDVARLRRFARRLT